MSDNEEIKKSIDAFQIFAKEFGPNDVYTQIILEILLEELLSPSYNTCGEKTNEAPRE